MSDSQNNFTGLEVLKTYLQNKEAGSITIINRNLTDYAGMALHIGIIFDTRKAKYELNLEWISYGLDLFGENLLENYLYQFESIENLLEYLEAQYAIRVTDILVKYVFVPDLYSNPIKDKEKKLLFEASWERFQKDFKTGAFLDPSLKLVYSTQQL